MSNLTVSTWVTMPAAKATHIERRRCQLRIIKGPDAKTDFAIERERVRVGTQSTCDLVLADPTVSSVHFELALDMQGYCLTDLGSKNGVWVGNTQIMRAYVEPGAELRIGNTVMRLSALDDSVKVPLSLRHRFGPLVGQSLKMRELYARLDRIASTEMTVLITGETGAGKEVVAQAVVEAGPRRDKPFLVFDCAATPAELIESELFGHVRGAFTGAEKERKGLFEMSDGGSILLDEIGELPLELQPKLLRVLDAGEVRPVGSNETRKLDVRVLAATNRDLDVEISRGTFRQDLYFRLAVAQVRVPPLRERLDDLPLLIDELAVSAGINPHETRFRQLSEQWSRYHWPGNVRELRNAIERCAILAEDAIPAPAIEQTAEPVIDLSTGFKEARTALIESFERRYIEALLQQHDGNISRAAKQAGIDRMTLHKLITRRRISVRRS